MADGGDHRYSFSPRERRGLVLGLGGQQLAAIGCGGILALLARSALGGPAGLLLGLIIAIAAVGTATWPVQGEPVGLRLATWLSWATRRRGVVLSEEPRRGSHRQPARRTRSGFDLLGRIDIAPVPGGPGDRSGEALVDKRSGAAVAVLPVSGASSFALLDPAGQAVQLDAWRSVLAAMALPAGPQGRPVRLQWVHRTSRTDEPGMVTAGGAGRALVAHQSWVAVAVLGGRRVSGRPGTASHSLLVDLGRERRLLEARIRAARLELGEAPAGDGLLSLLGEPGGVLAIKEHWDSVQCDGRWHSTYWIAEWPRVEVGPDFLGPVLLGGSERRIAVVMSPIDAERALREVRSSRTADLADEQLRARAGFLGSARREREAAGTARRERELTEGHQEFRFSGYVTVSAVDQERLRLARSEALHAAGAAHLELRLLYGRQAEAFTWTLPLCRGLR